MKLLCGAEAFLMGLFHIALEISDDSMKQFFKTGVKFWAAQEFLEFEASTKLIDAKKSGLIPPKSRMIPPKKLDDPQKVD